MPSMPDGQKCQCSKLTGHSVIEKSQPFIDITHDPCIGIDIETINNMLKSGGLFKDAKSDICASVPFDSAVLPFAIVTQTGENNSAFSE